MKTAWHGNGATPGSAVKTGTGKCLEHMRFCMAYYLIDMLMKMDGALQRKPCCARTEP